MKQIFLILSLFLFGCSNKDASHLPSLFEIPGAVIGNTIENTAYSHKRNKIKQYIEHHYDVLKLDIQKGEGLYLEELLAKADIDKEKYSKIKKELQADYNSMFRNIILSREAVMNAFGSIYLPKVKTKMMNRFTYTQASHIVDNYLKQHFEAFRLSLKHKKSDGLQDLANNLHIKEKERFYNLLYGRYEDLIIEPVVVAVMVRS